RYIRASKNAVVAKLMTIDVNVRAWGSGSKYSSAATPLLTIGGSPAGPAMIIISKLAALVNNISPNKIRVKVRSMIKYIATADSPPMIHSSTASMVMVASWRTGACTGGSHTTFRFGTVTGFGFVTGVNG